MLVQRHPHFRGSSSARNDNARLSLKDDEHIVKILCYWDQESSQDVNCLVLKALPGILSPHFAYVEDQRGSCFAKLSKGGMGNFK